MNHNDEPGEQHAADVVDRLKGIAASVRVLRLLGLPTKGDVSDRLGIGGTKDELLRLAAATGVPAPMVLLASEPLPPGSLSGWEVTLPDQHPIGGADAIQVLRVADASMPYAGESYTDLTDPEILADLGVPEGWREDPAGWDGWTVGLVRGAIEWIAGGNGDDEAATDEDDAERVCEDDQESGTTLGQELLYRVIHAAAEEVRLTRDRAAMLEAGVRDALVPSGDVLDRLQRYESHLGRQMSQALVLLKALQGTRAALQ